MVSADATIASQATGAMSWAFISALTKDPQQTYVELLNSVRDLLETNYSQKPQLSCSHPLGMSSLDPGRRCLMLTHCFLCRYRSHVCHVGDDPASLFEPGFFGLGGRQRIYPKASAQFWCTFRRSLLACFSVDRVPCLAYCSALSMHMVRRNRS